MHYSLDYHVTITSDCIVPGLFWKWLVCSIIIIIAHVSRAFVQHVRTEYINHLTIVQLISALGSVI